MVCVKNLLQSDRARLTSPGTTYITQIKERITMVGRERREDRQDDRGPGSGGDNRYQMVQKMVSIGDDFWIENGRGEKVYKVDGKALRVRSTLVFEDRNGQELCQIQEKMVAVRDTMSIEGSNGQPSATIKKALITPVRERFTLNIQGGPDIDIQGNLVDHEYTFEQGGRKIAETSKKWFHLRDSYGVEIEPGQNDILILAATVAIDMMENPGR
jgi:uncharacterized protein YxjI